MSSESLRVKILKLFAIKDYSGYDIEKIILRNNFHKGETISREIRKTRQAEFIKKFTKNERTDYYRITKLGRLVLKDN